MPWSADAPEAIKDKMAKDIFPVKILDRGDGSRHRLRATVVFKHALFHTDIMVNDDFSNANKQGLELTNENLIGEDLPIEQGNDVDLVVRR